MPEDALEAEALEAEALETDALEAEALERFCALEMLPRVLRDVEPLMSEYAVIWR